MSSDSPTDQWATSLSLLERARDKDDAAWRNIVHLYSPLVIHWCRQTPLSPGDIDDVVQDIFLSVSRELTRFRRDRPGDSFRGWLRVIARRRIADHFRRHADRPVAAGGTTAMRRIGDTPDLAPDVFASDDESEEAALTRRVLDLIRNDFQPNTWQAFWRTTMEGIAPADLMVELNMSQAAIRMARSRVLTRLRQEFDGILSFNTLHNRD